MQTKKARQVAGASAEWAARSATALRGAAAASAAEQRAAAALSREAEQARCPENPSLRKWGEVKALAWPQRLTSESVARMVMCF